jgi:hypothetical protein
MIEHEHRPLGRRRRRPNRDRLAARGARALLTELPGAGANLRLASRAAKLERGQHLYSSKGCPLMTASCAFGSDRFVFDQVTPGNRRMDTS